MGAMFPKYKAQENFFMFFMVNLASGVGSGQKSFNGLGDCLVKTAKGPSGFMGLYNGFGVSVMGIIPYRGVYFGMFDSLMGINPFRKEKSIVGLASKFAV